MLITLPVGSKFIYHRHSFKPIPVQRNQNKGGCMRGGLSFPPPIREQKERSVGTAASGLCKGRIFPYSPCINAWRHI